MSWWLDRAGVDHVVLERGVVGPVVAGAPLGLAASAHPELDEPAAGARTTSATTPTATSARPRWSTSSTATPARSAPRCSRTRRSSACGRRPRGSAWTPTAARGGAGPSSWRRDRRRVAGARARPRARRRPAADHRARLPRAGTGRAGRGAGRRRLGIGRADRRRAAAGRAAGDPRGRRPRAGAADLPRPRHLPLDGRAGHPRRALRRGRGPGPGPAAAVAAAGGLAAAAFPRPGHACPTAGVELTGRLVGIARGRALFSGSLANFLKAGDLKQSRLLDRVDASSTSTAGGRAGRSTGRTRRRCPRR